MTLSTFVLHLLNGLTYGSILILLASGLTIVWGLQGIVNCAHGVFYMLGAYLALTLSSQWGVSFFIAIPIAFIVNFALGAGLEIMGIRKLFTWGREFTHSLIMTLGFALLSQQAVRMIWGAVPQAMDAPESLQGVLIMGTVIYPQYYLFVMAFTAVVMIGLFLLFAKTGVGTLVRSVAINSEVSQALGTDAPRLNTLIFGLGTGVAGMAGVLAGPFLSVDPNMAFDLLILLFVVIIFGGLGSLTGVVVSGVIVGCILSFGAALISGLAAKILVFAVMVVVLIFKPLGLFGQGTVEE